MGVGQQDARVGVAAQPADLLFGPDVPDAPGLHRTLVEMAQQINVVALTVFQQQQRRHRVLRPIVLQTLPQPLVVG